MLDNDDKNKNEDSSPNYTHRVYRDGATRCAACMAEIHEDARLCPHCDHRFEKYKEGSNVTYYLSGIFALYWVFESLTGLPSLFGAIVSLSQLNAINDSLTAILVEVLTIGFTFLVVRWWREKSPEEVNKYKVKGHPRNS